MARIRTVKPTIWESEQIGEVSLEARLTFIGLITQSDCAGRQKGSPRRIKGKLFPYDEITATQVDGWLDELADAGLILRYESNGVPLIGLPTWSDHQKIDRPQPSRLPSAFDEGVEKIRGTFVERSSGEGKGREGIEEGKGRDSSVVTEEEAPLSFLLADLIQGNDPDGVRPTVTRRWADAERRMLDIDRRPEVEAQRLITWTMNDEFWRGPIQSMPKFRQKYRQLYEAAKNSGTKAASKEPAGMAKARAMADKLKKGKAQ